MSGICGMVGNKGEKLLTETVLQMCSLIKHRGTDGRMVVNGRNWAIGCCQRKLIDLSDNAIQPMVSEDGACFMVCDGRIYNYRELRDELEKRGHIFKSASDIEVILHLLEDEGDRGIGRIRGQFAFAFVDTRSGNVLLARDRFGVKPLYYMKLVDAFIFVSEIKAVFCYPRNSPQLNMERIAEFLQYRYISGEQTLFAGIYELKPSSYLRVNLKNMTAERYDYWTLPSRDETRSTNEEEIMEQLKQSVQKLLVIDRPVGLHLSGGLDSSIITKLATGVRADVKHAFCASFFDESIDETKWAIRAASESGVTLHRVQYREEDFIEDFALCTWLHDEPLNHPNSCVLYRVSRKASSYVPVVLSGEGGDEMFCGYSWQMRLWRLRRLGKLIHHPLLAFAGTLFPAKGRLGRLRAILGKSMPEIIVEVTKCVDNRILSELVYMPLYQRHSQTCIDIGEMSDTLTAMITLDLRTTLLSALQSQDRMSMAGGIEPFMPYLEYDLAEKVLRIPVNILLENGRNKAILKRIAGRLLPIDMVERPKIGFRVPIVGWMRNKNGMYQLLDWLYDDCAVSRGIWRADVARRFVQMYVNGYEEYFEILWSMLSFEIWARLWLDGASVDVLTEKIIKQCNMHK